MQQEEADEFGGLGDAFGRLFEKWQAMRQSWQDERAAMFDETIMQQIGSKARQLSVEFEEFLRYFADVRSQMVDLGFVGPERDESELSRRQTDAEMDWHDAESLVRRRFGLDFGQFGHEQFEQELLEREEAAGRVRNVDFGIEYVLNHPGGGQVRYDYVDLKAHRIVDYKSARPGQAATDVASDHRGQRQRHIEAYVHSFGVVPSYTYETYPSTTGLFAPENEQWST